MKIKLLAHISGRSTKENDDRARRQLDACLRFVPARRILYTGLGPDDHLRSSAKRATTPPTLRDKRNRAKYGGGFKEGPIDRESETPTPNQPEMSESCSKYSDDEVEINDGPGFALSLLVAAEKRWKASHPHVSEPKTRKPPASKDPLDNTQAALLMLMTVSPLTLTRSVCQLHLLQAKKNCWTILRGKHKFQKCNIFKA
jgi:hypothetical protein